MKLFYLRAARASLNGTDLIFSSSGTLLGIVGFAQGTQTLNCSIQASPRSRQEQVVNIA